MPIEIQDSDDDKITFGINDKVIFELTEDGFVYNGQVIKDAGKAYNLFIDFLSQAVKEVAEEED